MTFKLLIHVYRLLIYFLLKLLIHNIDICLNLVPIKAQTSAVHRSGGNKKAH